MVELAKGFEEQLTSVALHPSGLFLLVGFSDRLRLLSILMDDFRSRPHLCSCPLMLQRPALQARECICCLYADICQLIVPGLAPHHCLHSNILLPWLLWPEAG